MGSKSGTRKLDVAPALNCTRLWKPETTSLTLALNTLAFDPPSWTLRKCISVCSNRLSTQIYTSAHYSHAESKHRCYMLVTWMLPFTHSGHVAIKGAAHVSCTLPSMSQGTTTIHSHGNPLLHKSSDSGSSCTPSHGKLLC